MVGSLGGNVDMFHKVVNRFESRLNWTAAALPTKEQHLYPGSKKYVPSSALDAPT
jgi:hypothetical protein